MHHERSLLPPQAASARTPWSHRALGRQIVLLVCLAWMGCGFGTNAKAQGLVLFDNLVLPGLDAPVFDNDCVTKLAGSGGYVAQLYASSSPMPSTLAAVGVPVAFSSGAGAGYVFGGGVAIPGVPPGTIAYVQLRAWDTAAGATYPAAFAAGGKVGSSAIVAVITTDGITPPATITGLTSFSLTAPIADAFGSASRICANSTIAFGSTTGFGGEAGEPTHCSIAGGASGWFVYAPASGTSLTIDTAGSGFDTVLAIYTGASLPTLVPIACDNDSGPGSTSQVTFAAMGGADYYIAVDGVSGATGNVVLNVQSNPNVAPTLTTVSPLAGAVEDTLFPISYATLAAAADEADGNLDALSFRVEAVSTGSLTKNSVPVVPGTTLLSSGETWSWVAAPNANGTLNAFTVVAFDGLLASAPPVQVQVTVDPVNDVPVITLDRTITAGAFGPKVDFATGVDPYGLATADLDGDGKPELAAANFLAHTISVFRNLTVPGYAGAGAFASPVTLSGGGLSAPNGVAAGDLDGDGEADLVVANYTSGSISIFRNTSTLGSISFAGGITLASAASQFEVTLKDLDGDSKQELISANYGGGSGTTVSVFRNTSTIGSISFAPRIDLTTETAPVSVTAADLDGDLKPDLAIANYNPGFRNVSVFRNTSSGVGSISFGAKQDIDFGATGPSAIRAADLDGDGKPELVVTRAYTSRVSVLGNSSTLGAIAFAPSVEFVTGDNPFAVEIADLNGDGHRDLAVANFGLATDGTTISVLPNNGLGGGISAGSFAAKVDFTTGTAPGKLNIADLDADTKLDLAVPNYASDSISVLRNRFFSTPVNTPSAPFAFTVGDVETAPGALVVLGLSSVPGLVSPADIAFGGSDANRNAVLTPVADQTGITTITVSVSDPPHLPSVNFVLTVEPVFAEFTVTTTADSGPGSLRQAILNANASPGTDTIDFAIPGLGQHTIQPLSALPTVTDPVIIDGYTQPGSSANTLALGNNAVLRIELDGSSAGIGVNGLVIEAGSSVVRGLVINRFQVLQPMAIGGDGLRLLVSGGNTIEGNFIGTDTTGTLERENGSQGILVQSAGNLIGGTAPAARNVISGNHTQGIGISGASGVLNQVEGNYIGTDKTGTARLNNSSGVEIKSSNNFIGGTALGAGNVISGNGRGIYLVDAASGNMVQGNRIGTDPTGTTSVFNTTAGVEIAGGPTGNIIGGTVPEARNLISGNQGQGIEITGAGSDGNYVRGNFIGLQADGSAALGNAGNGVRIRSGAIGNVIGGTTSDERNVISANAAGVILMSGAHANVVQGNYIGTDVTGTLDLGNSGSGVLLENVNSTTIGGTALGAGNLISGNNADGVLVTATGSTRNDIQGNTIGLQANGTAIRGNGGSGVRIDSGATGNTVGGNTAAHRNIISANAIAGIALQGVLTTGNQVQANYIGTDVNGTADLGNAENGVSIDQASNNTVGGNVAGQRNVISGNGQRGVFINGANASGNVVQGNFVGVNKDGVVALGNADHGILILGAPANTVGDPADGDAGNVISGNGHHGLALLGGSTANVVGRNYIGTDATGIAALGNAFAGISIVGADNELVNNLVSGNVQGGVELAGALSTGNVLLGNLIGPDVTGVSALANGPSGSGVLCSAPGNFIGAAGAGNVISGNQGNGITFLGAGASGNTVQGNFIGTDSGGTVALGNLGRGIHISSGQNNLIGGPTPNAANIIAHNAALTGGTPAGVGITGPTATGNQVRQNSIFANTGLGFDLGLNGATPNDPADADGSPNNLQNFPILSVVKVRANTLEITYAVDSSTANSAYPLTIEFYRADADGEEGQTFIAEDSYTAAEAQTTKTIVIPRPSWLLATHQVTATATDANGNTSEFFLSGGQAPAVQSAPTLSTIDSLTLLQNTASSVLNFTLGDDDPGDLGAVVVTASSSNPSVIPNSPANVALGGGGANRTVQVTAGMTLGLSDITITATDPAGCVSTMTFTVNVITAPCADNISWFHACQLDLTPNPLQSDVLEAAADQSLEQLDQSRWFKFAIQPGSRVVVTLTGLPANYDLVLYKDIGAKFQELTALASTDDLALLTAEFAPEAYSPEAYSPEAYSPEAYSPEAYSPEAYSPEAYSPEAYSPEAYSPEAYSPEAYSPEAYSPEAYSPEAYSPEAYSPEAYSPEAYSPEAYSPEAYSDAQTRCVLGVSAFAGLSGEGLIANTWDNIGNFYVRVRGRNGAYRPGQPFHLEVKLFTGACGTVNLINTPSTIVPDADNYQTIVLADFNRLEGTAAEKAALQTKLAAFISRSEVAGVLVDVGTDARVLAANLQADANKNCVFAKNLVAEAIRDVVLSYQTLNEPTLKYVVIIGHDDVIPFFRHPDQALLASEQNYFPPVRDNTHSQASLRLGHVLSQDKYGAICEVSLKAGDLPLPDLAVGRIVESASEASAMLDAYLATTGGLAPPVNSSLITGYDFLTDAAEDVQTQLQDGIGTGPLIVHDAFIADPALSPQSVTTPVYTPGAVWTAQHLRDKLLEQRYSVAFLAGHFSANSMLASDFSSRVFAAELAATPTALANSLFCSPGCHAGYNIVDPHGVDNVTVQPDWAQACAIKGINLLAGTAYQYGDTDFVEYSERLYLEFFRQLRLDAGPKAIGRAVVDAKRQYLANTVQMRGIHAKALLQVTLFGFPMLKIDLPNKLPTPPDASIITALVSYPAVPPSAASVLGLVQGTTPAIIPDLTLESKGIDEIDPDTPETELTAYYFRGAQDVVTTPGEPVLPLEVRDVTVAGKVLRGVGLWQADYLDTPSGVLPLTGAPATETRGVHGPFVTAVHYPIRPWNVNYFDALCSDSPGRTRLLLTPAQFKSDAPGSVLGTFRQFTSLHLKFFYSENITTYSASGTDSTPALSDAPSLADIAATSNLSGSEVMFSARAHGNVAAGIQEVWVTYTATAGPLYGKWQSRPLTQQTRVNVGCPPAEVLPVCLDEDSTLWKAALVLPAGTLPHQIRFMVQAVNGVGLVTLATAVGAYYIPDQPEDPEPPPIPPAPTTLSLLGPPGSVAYGSIADVSAVLTDAAGLPLAGKSVVFTMGSQRKEALTDAAGVSGLTLQFMGLPADYELQAAFEGDAAFASSSSAVPVAIVKQQTTLTLEPHPDTTCNLLARLTDAADHSLAQKSVFFVLRNLANQVIHATSEITDYAGQAALGPLPFASGNYTVQAYFMGTIPLVPPQPALILTDQRYDADVSDLVAFTIAPQPATVAYTGDTEIDPGATLHLGAQVTATGDLTLALVQFQVFSQWNNALVATIQAPVASDGSSLAAVTGLTPGAYRIETRVVSSCFLSALLTTIAHVGPFSDIDDLQAILLGYNLHQGTSNSLMAKLNAAEASLAAGNVTAACNQLGAFISEVNAQTPRRITVAQAAVLLAHAQSIRASIGCAP